MNSNPELFHWLQRVTRWKFLFASWQLGTRLNTDPECNAVNDHREVTILLRVEFSALTNILIRKGIFTQEEFEDAIISEAMIWNAEAERRFPGFSTTEVGLTLNPKKAYETMRRYNFKP